jgi:predicted phage terminase large subunit-like protein
MNSILASALFRKQRRDKARGSLEFFAGYYLPHILEDATPYFHKEIYNLLGTENRLCIAAPRGFAKSTITQLIYGLHCLLYQENADILTISQSSSLAEDWVRKIKFELESNDRIKSDFGAILQWGDKDSKRWTANHLIIQKGERTYSQIRARGRGCQVRGLRPSIVICDDLEDEEMVRSEDQRKFLKEWFLGALLNVLKPDQQLIVIGTMLHPLALLGEIINKKEQFGGWTTRKYVALTDGKSLWEARYSAKALLQRKLEIGTYAFESEFQNNPISSDICLWRPDWVLRYETLPEIKIKFAALDPAASIKERADYSSMTCMGVGTDEKIYEIETLKGRWGTWDLIDRIIKFYLKHKPIRFGIEEIAFQSIIRQVLLREARNQGVVIPVEPITLGKYTGKEKQRRSPKDKYTRALSVIHYWEQGLVYLKTPDLIDELSLFPTGSHDDSVDSCVWCMMMIKKYAPLRVMIESPKLPQEIRGFEVKDNTMPCLASIEELFADRGTDWRIGQ